MKLFKYTLEELKEAVKTSVSKRQTLIKLNISPCGGNYKTFDKAVEYYKIDTSHFTGKLLLNRKLPQRRLNIKEYLKEGSSIQSNKLRKYLLESKVFESKCYKCKNIEWNNLPIPLELEHINGINNDNRLENLIFLCPNCHSQTATHGGKKNKK